MTVIAAGAVVLGDRVHRPGWLSVLDGRIVACGSGRPPTGPDFELVDRVVVPGFVDMHCHGGAGVSYADAPDRAAALHAAHGTTGGLASLVTAGPDALLAQVRRLAAATARGVVDGIHLEGPWLSRLHCGAHDSAQLRAPTDAEVDALLAAGDGAIRMVTLAPELPGAIATIGRLVEAGIVVAVGHTDADYELTQAAVDAGATVGTHLFNAMRALHHRQPGPVPALLDDPRVTVELIADGVHLHPGAIRHVVATAGPDRVALVTDAMAAAGAGDGAFSLGGLAVDVADGVARLRGTATIAGSTATMDRLFATAVRLLGADDAALAGAVRMTSATPARAIGLHRTGVLATGRDADLVVLDRDWRVCQVMRRGAWLS
ncbi:N-acetylglucosamine-6-phosphate deacetylase [Mycolicibacter hiberniae]|uniref:N-acetylglucosamine-6-phosphate deacetylase n=1 Tax=Mycolicibacter hiberniae TaxID=29314 RepID=A0A7I7X3S0_9MYCO|nr:N-acetylglucosamine-6-phosphate deacetylase [Mycolicibacter hiberniae]MCV7086039.1 N-acetylglucosamine-6-phosphate deacetylase [Mycolicibacter hiberniae]ORV70606.1 N-acetylglucosamine-6-phosphate deacetylase [Mycolicibacter hiberniae]BBZ24152.1 N-acetylglucosamine-6-phosphate deacetylase [Mycolicibacter hiberniae]